MFPSWGDVLAHIEVVKVVVGLIDDPARFVNYVCEKFAEEAIQQIRQGNEFSDLHLLVDITKESRHHIMVYGDFQKTLFLKRRKIGS